MISNVTVDRTDEGSIRICWESNFNDLDVTIYVGDSMETIHRGSPAVRVSGETCARISGIDPNVRHYFEVVPEDGSGVFVAERRVPLRGAVNFRDLGGYETSDGRRIKWDHIFRSDNLARLTDKDQDLLRQIGIKLVCDLRTPSEVKKGPDRLPNDGSVEYLHLPITHREGDSVSVMEKIRKGDIEWISEEFMTSGYIKNIDEFPEIWGRLFSRLAEPESRPMVFHCTGGKDRAGTCAALILLALGVPEETVVYDHQLSNIFIAKLLEKIYNHFRSIGVDPEKVAPYFIAPKSCMIALLDHIRETYGSATNYLETKARISSETLSFLKQELLE